MYIDIDCSSRKSSSKQLLSRSIDTVTRAVTSVDKMAAHAFFIQTYFFFEVSIFFTLLNNKGVFYNENEKQKNKNTIYVCVNEISAIFSRT